MPYPLLSEYLEAIKSSEDNFKALSYLHPVLDAECNPVMTSGNFAVVFKMKDEYTGKLYAIKCFTRNQDGRAESYKMITEELDSVDSSYIAHFKYFDKELFVDTANSDETEYPVLQMDWVEGQTLDKYIRENINDQYALEMLAYQFSRLAMWLLPQPFAHGDLKPDNIIVREDGTLTLVDYDGMYVPAMKGQMARELGSPGFRHPSRMVEEFNEHIDDFPIASILLSLKAIALQPTLLEEYGASDRLLLSEEDYRNISQSQFFKQVFPSDNMELNKLMNLFMLALSENNLSGVSSSLFNLQKPEEPEVEVYSTEVTKEDLANAWTDEFGVKYSPDRKRLLKAPDDLGSYSVIEGTLVICDYAFLGGQDEGSYMFQDEDHPYWGCYSIYEIRIPDSVVSIGKGAFSGCVDLEHIRLPNNLMYIGEAAFISCIRIKSIFIPRTLKTISFRAFEGCENLQSVIISRGVAQIEEYAFRDCESLEFVLLPDSLTSIGKFAFTSHYSPRINADYYIPPGTKSKFESLIRFYGYKEPRLIENTFELEPENYTYSSEVKGIDLKYVWIDEYGVKYSRGGKRLIQALDCLETYSIREETKTICNLAFNGCRHLTSIILPESLITIGNSAFEKCFQLSSIVIPNSVVTIEGYAFEHCKSLTSITIPDSVTSIGNYAFEHCDNLTSIAIPKNVIKIGYGILRGCSNLISLEVDKENIFFDSRGNCNAVIDKNSKTLVAGCSSTYIPNDVLAIGVGAFYECQKLTSIILPESVAIIEDNAFCLCENLNSIAIPNRVTFIGDDAFSWCHKLSSIVLSENLTSIGKSAFEGCDSLTSIVIPKNVVSIGHSAFRQCYKLKSINLPNSISSIGEATFYDCCSLNSLIIPDSVIDIGNYAFSGCRNLESIVIPNSMKSIGYKAFRDCNNLRTITIPESVSSVDKNAFEGCYSLEEILIPPKSKMKFEQMLPNYKHLLKEV